jgi:hypothetical protein
VAGHAGQVQEPDGSEHHQTLNDKACLEARAALMSG